MSEFKFACPVCGQHITADSGDSGGQIECPTCFQKIVVPQAPAAADSKFILAASQVSKPRPTRTTAPVQLELIPAPPTPKPLLLVAAAGLGLAVVAGASLWFFRGNLFHSGSQRGVQNTNVPHLPAKAEAKAPPKPPPPIPTNFTWNLDLTNAAFPAEVAAGSIHGSGFLCERAVLQGGSLSLRQTRGDGSPEASFTVNLFAQQGEELSDKTVEVGPERTPPVPRVDLRWRNDERKSTTERFSSGYALKVTFGAAINGRIPGRIYLCLPDDAKSFVAGTFDAEIRKPEPRKPRTPKKS